MEKEMIIVLDFGGQYNQLIARRVRECNVYAEVHPYTLSLEKIKEMNPKGIIFTGGPNSVYAEDSPTCDRALFGLGIPVLGICYGSQLMAYKLGGRVETAPVSEYGHTEVELLYTGDGKEPDGTAHMESLKRSRHAAKYVMPEISVDAAQIQHSAAEMGLTGTAAGRMALPK